MDVTAKRTGPPVEKEEEMNETTPQGEDSNHQQCDTQEAAGYRKGMEDGVGIASKHAARSRKSWRLSVVFADDERNGSLSGVAS